MKSFLKRKEKSNTKEDHIDYDFIFTKQREKRKKVDYWLSGTGTRNKAGLRDLLEGRKR